MIRDPVLMGGSKRIIAQKPRLWKANFANDTNGAVPCRRVRLIAKAAEEVNPWAVPRPKRPAPRAGGAGPQSGPLAERPQVAGPGPDPRPGVRPPR